MNLINRNLKKPIIALFAIMLSLSMIPSTASANGGVHVHTAGFSVGFKDRSFNKQYRKRSFKRNSFNSRSGRSSFNRNSFNRGYSNYNRGYNKGYNRSYSNSYKRNYDYCPYGY